MAKLFYYPLFFQSKVQDVIVKFTDLKTGEIIVEHPNAKKGKVGFMEPKGTIVTHWVPHTDTNSWIEVENPNIKESATQTDQKRNLAFYKKSNIPWTKAEAINICDYCGDVDTNFDEEHIPEAEYFYDTGSGIKAFMYAWTEQIEQRINECELLCYEDIFETSSIGRISKDEFIQTGTPALYGFNTFIPIKENTMAQDTKIEIKVNGKQIKLENNTPKVPTTDLKAHSKYVTIWFDNVGRITDQTSQSVKEATKKLQNPSKLGHTFITYKKVTSRTTNIPTVEV